MLQKKVVAVVFIGHKIETQLLPIRYFKKLTAMLWLDLSVNILRFFLTLLSRLLNLRLILYFPPIFLPLPSFAAVLDVLKAVRFLFFSLEEIKQNYYMSVLFAARSKPAAGIFIHRIQTHLMPVVSFSKKTTTQPLIFLHLLILFLPLLFLLLLTRLWPTILFWLPILFSPLILILPPTLLLLMLPPLPPTIFWLLIFLPLPTLLLPPILFLLPILLIPPTIFLLPISCQQQTQTLFLLADFLSPMG